MVERWQNDKDAGMARRGRDETVKSREGVSEGVFLEWRRDVIMHSGGGKSLRNVRGLGVGGRMTGMQDKNGREGRDESVN